MGADTLLADFVAGVWIYSAGILTGLLMVPLLARVMLKALQGMMRR